MPVINVVTPGAIFPEEEGPCTWPLDTDCCPGWDEADANTRALAASWSTYILWALTGRRYGPCSVIVRPCGSRCEPFAGYLTWPVGLSGSGAASGLWMAPFIDGAGTWRNCACSGGCSCAARCEIALRGPVAAIDEVKVDGVVIDPSAYRLDEFKGLPYLVRTDGECWPECQDVNLADTETGTFSVTYQHGTYVPRAGQIAAGKLACEFIKSCQGGDCVLPENLVSMSRNGIEVSVADPTEILNAGLTGVADVDLWIRAVNPGRKSQPSRVYSPDLPPVRYTT